jgi:predicted transposase YbfD/YdcC
MCHVALGPDGAWVALIGYGSAALACGPRDEHIGWDDETHFRRPRYVVNNQRYCVLGTVPATTSPRRCCRGACAGCLATTRRASPTRCFWWRPSSIPRHVGTCYVATGFRVLGETAGFRRSAGRYHHHGSPKLYLAKALRPDAASLLADTFDHPALRKGANAMIDLNALDFDSEGGLLARLEEIVDHRRPRGVRHPLASILAMATAATLAGARSVAAIGEYAADCPQEVLRRLGAKHHPVKRRYIPPHAETFRRALAAVDTDALDQVVGAWLFDQVRAGALGEDEVVLALDGKSMRGALRDDGKAVHLFSAMIQASGVVVAQAEVDQKSNEITAFRPLLEGLELEGALVTADAMHTQREHARFLVEDKRADYLFQIKDNQPGLLARVKAIPATDFSPEHEEHCKGHGRTEHRYVRTAPAPDDLDFPYAAQVVVVYRERGDLADRMGSAETSFYITSVSAGRARPERLARHVRGHWGIENKLHWVRDWNFDEDRHQLRAASSTARAMATLRNLAISLLRLAGVTNIAAATRGVARDASRAAALLGAGA